MKKKIVWLVVSGWMVAALLVTSCAPAVVKEAAEKVAPVKEKEVVVPKAVVVPEKEANLVKWTGTKLDGTVVEKILEKPKYGGVYTYAKDTQPQRFDDIPSYSGNIATHPVQESLITGDWTRGPAGTGEWVMIGSMSNIRDFGLEVDGLVESWEVTDDTTLLFHIRKGVHWQDKPPLNGRELTADDVVFTLRRQHKIGYPGRAYGFLLDQANPANSVYVSPTDKWTVVVKTQPRQAALIIIASAMGFTKIIAPETVGGVIDAGKVIIDWKDVVGTGAFILKEYVGASALTYVRNPNYWGNDPLFPQNQLPYLDGLKILIIPDISTRMAGLRTGKIDSLIDFFKDDAESLRKTNPELEWGKYLTGGAGGAINPRNDTKPFDDIRVRRALMMAMNYREITDVYYGGDAVLFTYPILPVPDYMALYKPLEEYPQSVQELYTYNPEKAKKLLAEAGYPNGFKTEILVWAPKDIDVLQIVKEYWAKIGVDLKIDVRDYSVWQTMFTTKSYTQIIMKGITDEGFLFDLPSARKRGLQNVSIVEDPYHEKVRQGIMEDHFDTAKRNAHLTTPLAEGLPGWREYAAEKVWWIPLPAPYHYHFWQPWLKNYYGTRLVFGMSDNYARYIWIDQELKKAMGR